VTSRVAVFAKGAGCYSSIAAIAAIVDFRYQWCVVSSIDPIGEKPRQGVADQPSGGRTPCQNQVKPLRYWLGVMPVPLWKARVKLA
jgi:hypothetical protein